MNQLLCQAIQAKRRIRFEYHDKPRLVEPQAHGLGTTGKELLRGYQLQGGVQPEPLFEVGKIRRLELLDERFQQPGPHYKRNDSAMVEIFCQL